MNVNVVDGPRVLFSIWLQDFTARTVSCRQIVSLSYKRRWSAKIREWVDDRQIKIMVDGQDEYGRPACVPFYANLSAWDWEQVDNWMGAEHEVWK